MTALTSSSDALAWHQLTWPDFLLENPDHPLLAIQPVVSLAERGPQIPINLEERLMIESLSVTISELPQSPRIRILPTFNRVPRLEKNQVFATGVPEATEALTEVASSIGASGVKKIVFLHLNTAIGDWLNNIARKIHIEKNLQVFTIDLRGMGAPDPNESAPDITSDCSSVAKPLRATLLEILAFPELGGKNPTSFST